MLGDCGTTADSPRKGDSLPPRKKIPRRSNRLTARSVATAKPKSRLHDGGGLYLIVSKTGSKKYSYRYTFGGRVTETGLGSASVVTLTEARNRAHECRKMVASGINPVAAKRDREIAKAAQRSFGECVDAFLAAKSSEWSNAKHRMQWQQTLVTHAAPIWHLPIDEVNTTSVRDVLDPIWQSIPETARRVRGRIESVLNFAKANHWRSGENCAAWRGHLALTMSRGRKTQRDRHKAIPFGDLPAFIGRLREQQSTSVAAIALEFTILTCARTGETLGARWLEFDLDAKIWRVPAARMKGRREHRVPLAARALEIIEDLSKARVGDFVFPGRRLSGPLSGNSMLTVLRKMKIAAVTVHGFRSPFSDWASEKTSFPYEVIEACLAHVVGNSVARAYRRGDVLEKRRAVLDAWGSFCEGEQHAKVIPMRA